MHQPFRFHKFQNGATLVISLLLMTVLTLFSMSAMQSSHLSFKSQLSRVNFQRNVGEISALQSLAVKRIKSFLDSRSTELPDQLSELSEGFELLDDLLMGRHIGYENDQLVKTLSYMLPELQVEVYISHSRVYTDFRTGELVQFGSYGNERLNEGAEVTKYLYLQVHCIATPRKGQNQADIHISGDYRLKV